MNILKITSIVGLSALVLSGCKGAEEEIDGSSNNNSSVKVELVEDKPKNTQLDATFPLETSSDNYSSRILPSVIKSFHHYKNQGTVMLSPKNVTDFNLFVNGKKVNIDNDEWENESVYQLDISDYTVNGNNSIQISDVKGDEPQVHVQISYPTVIDDDEYYTDNETLDLVDSIIESEMENGFTSAQLTVIKDGKIRKSESYGHVNSYNADGTLIEEDESAEVTEETLFDLASNTKMYATNYAIQKLVSEEEISTEDLVSDYFTDFKDDESDEISGKDVMTIEDLLTHQAGFPADPQYHNNNFTDIEENEDGENALFSQDKSTTKDMILKTPLVYEPGTETRYSDVDYMLLGLIVEQVSGNDLDTYVKKNFYEPLGLDKLTFNPLDNGFEKNEIAATELQGNTRDGVVDFENIRTETIQGEVHDEKAYYAMDGISGHAGLFSNAKNLATLAQVMLNKGGYGDNTFFSEEVVQDFTKASDINDTYGLGWRRQGASNNYSWAFSSLADSETYGHTGWTGTLTVVDPSNDLIVVLLTSAKNSPVLDKENDPNTMLGNKYLTSNYGTISSLIFTAMDDNNPTEKSDSLLIELVDQKLAQIKELPEAWDNEPSKHSYNALVDILNERKDGSDMIQDFLDNNEIKALDIEE